MEKLLIWDIDGTLIDCKGTGRRAMDKTFKKLFDIHDGFSNVSMAGSLDWHIVRNALDINKIVQEDIAEFLKEYSITLEEELKFNNCMEILPGIKEILDNTKNHEHVYHALGTGNCEQGARIKLFHLGLDTYFQIGGYGDENILRWQVIEKVINKAKDYYKVNFYNENVYVVGDTPKDIECGKKLGVRSIAVATGAYNYKELLNCSPDYIFDNFESFSDFISIILK